MRLAPLSMLLLLAGCGGESAADLDRKALDAFRSGDLVGAEIAAEKAAAKGGPGFEARRDFLMGNSTFARCEKEELAAMGPRGAAAIDAAIGHAVRASDFWRLAAASRSDWPEARRNVERAILKLEQLKRKKAELEPESRRQPKPKPDPRVKDNQPKSQRPELVPGMKVDPILAELPAEQVQRIFDRLRDKEKDKIRLRKAQQAAANFGVEKDW